MLDPKLVRTDLEAIAERQRSPSQRVQKRRVRTLLDG